MIEISSDIILEQMMSLHPKEIDLTLDRVWRLLEAVGSPEKSLPPVIHIAGTNGKSFRGAQGDWSQCNAGGLYNFPWCVANGRCKQ